MCLWRLSGVRPRPGGSDRLEGRVSQRSHSLTPHVSPSNHHLDRARQRRQGAGPLRPSWTTVMDVGGGASPWITEAPPAFDLWPPGGSNARICTLRNNMCEARAVFQSEVPANTPVRTHP